MKMLRCRIALRKVTLTTLLTSLIAGGLQAATFYSRGSGNWNVAANWSQATYGGAASATYPGQTGTTDIVFISGHAITVSVTPPNAVAGITLNQLGTSAATKLTVSAASVVLTCTGFTMLDANVNQDMDLEVGSSARLQVNGAFTVTRSTTNSRNKRMRVYALSTGVITTTGNFIYTYGRSGGENQIEVQLDNTAQLNVGGNLQCVIGNNAQGNDNFNFRLNNTPQVNVTGSTNFTVQNTDDGDNFVLDINGGTFTSGGAMTLLVANTATGNSIMDAQIDGATVNANGGLTLNQQAGSTFDVLINSNSTAVEAVLSVVGNLLMTHAAAASDQTLQTNATSSVGVTGNMVLTLNDNSGDDQNLDLNGGTFTVAGNLTSTTTGTGNSQQFYWTLDGNSTMTVGGEVNITQLSGGPLYLYLNSNNGSGASLNVGSDLTVDHTAGSGKVEFDLYASSSLAVGRDLRITSAMNASNDDIWIGLHSNNTLNVVRDLLLTMSSGTNGNNDITLRQWSGSTTIGRDVIFTKSAGDEAYWNQDGGTATIGRDFKFISTGGDDCWLYLDNASTMSVNGNLLFDMQGGDEARLYLNETAGNDAVLNVTGNLTFSKVAAAGDVEFLQAKRSRVVIGGNLDWTHRAGNNNSHYRISNSTNSLFIGGNMNLQLLAGTSSSDDFDLNFEGGPVAVVGNVLLRHAAGDDYTATLANQMSFSIGGTLTMDHTGGDDFIVDMNNNNTLLQVNGNVVMNDGAGGGTTTTWRMDNASQARLLGDLSMTATAGAQIILDMNNTSYMWIKGSILRGAAPNHFGSLQAAGNSIIEFNGTANTQLITDDAGNGGDSFHYEKVVINNTFGTYPQLITEGTTTIWNDIQFQNGVLGTASARRLVIASGSTSNVGNASSFVDGPMKKIGNGAFTFPVGKSGFWARLAMASMSQAQNTTEFDCEYFASASPNNSSTYYGAGVDHVSYNEHWSLVRTADPGNDANCNVRLYWENSSRSSILLNSDLRVAGFRSSNTKWNNQGGTGVGGASGSILSTTALTEFGLVTFASAGGLNPLPVELLSFEATDNGDVVDLHWTTASEHGNDHFTIERSADLTDFREVLMHPAVGNSVAVVNYVDQDRSPLEGWSYYRLKQTDTDGAFTYSNVVAVKRASSAVTKPVVVYPNPSADDLNIAFDGEVEGPVRIDLIDALGRSVWSSTNAMTASSAKFDVSNVPAGTYRVVLTSTAGVIGAAAWVRTGS